MNKQIDTIQQRFDAAVKKYNIIGVPKRLIDSDGNIKNEFIANGTKYVFLHPDKCFNIVRQTMYHNINMAFSCNQTPIKVRQRFAEAKNTMLKIMGAKGNEWNKLMEKMLRDTFNNLDSFYGELTSRYGSGLYLNTLWWCKEGEDLSQWDWEMATSKIEDWSKENIAIVDFFIIARTFSEDCLEIMKLSSQDLEEMQRVKSSGDIQ